MNMKKACVKTPVQLQRHKRGLTVPTQEQVLHLTLEQQHHAYFIEPSMIDRQPGDETLPR